MPIGPNTSSRFGEFSQCSTSSTSWKFRLRGLDVHRVLRCTRLPHERQLPSPARDQLAPLEELARRLERCGTREETSQELLAALEDIFDIRYAILFTPDAAAQGLLATAGSGAARAMLSTTVNAGAGMIGTAASRRRVIMTANLQRARALASAAAENADTDAALASPLPGLPDARNAAAVPLIVGEDLLGVLYLESAQPAAFSGPVEGLLHILGAYTAAALAARAEPSSQSPARSRAAAQPRGRRALQLVYYQADDTILCDSAYIVKGAPGRILWAMLTSHSASGRTRFTNRELRLNESLGLPAGNDNLEARLLVLRRRLASIDCGVTLERVGRGRLELRLRRPANLTVIPTTDPMRSAHTGHVRAIRDRLREDRRAASRSRRSTVDRSNRAPPRRAPAGSAPGRERFFHRATDGWALAVVEFGKTPAIIVTVFLADKPPARRWRPPPFTCPRQTCASRGPTS